MLKGIVQCSGGYIGAFYLAYPDMTIDDILTAIEVTAEVHSSDSSDALWDSLFNGGASGG